MSHADEIKIDVRERGANQQTSDRRLFMQLLALGDCPDPKPLVRTLESARVDAVVYRDLNDPRGVGILGMSEDPAFFVGAFRELLDAPSFDELPIKAELTMVGRTYASGFESDLEPELSVVTYRYAPKQGDADDFNRRLLKKVIDDGRVFISSTMLNGKFTLRFACLAFRTHLKTVDTLLEILRQEVDGQ